MGIITSMLIDYEDAVYQYTPQRYSVDVREGHRILAGGPRVNMLGFEDYRLDLRYWEIEKKEVSENGEWQTLHFRKRERREIEVVKDHLTESPKTYTAYGYEEIDGKFYVFSSSKGAETFDLSEWTVKKALPAYPGHNKQALMFTRKAS